MSGSYGTGLRAGDAMAVGEHLPQHGRREQIPSSAAAWLYERHTAESVLTMSVLPMPAGSCPHAQWRQGVRCLRLPARPDGARLGEKNPTPASPLRAHALRASLLLDSGVLSSMMVREAH